MSIATEIQRLQNAKADIKSAIENKGVTVGDGLIDTYAELISQIASGGSNVGYKTSEVKITSSITNANALFDIIFENIDLNHNCVAYLSYPQETNYIYNQVTFLSNTDGVRRGVRYRDGVYSNIELTAAYDASVTIGDIYTVVDLDEYIEDKDYDQGYEDGKNSVVPLERYSKQIQLKSLNIFGKSEAVLNLDNAENLTGLCTIQGQGNPNVNTTVEHLTINCPNQVTTLNQMLHCDNYCVDKKLKRLTLNIDTQKSISNSNTFNNLQALEVIDGEPINLSSSGSNNMFGNCISLVYVRFVPLTIPKNISFSKSGSLSDETTQSIIDGLADLTGGTAQTLTLHATVGAKLTDEQKATITAKNWTLVY